MKSMKQAGIFALTRYFCLAIVTGLQGERAWYAVPHDDRCLAGRSAGLSAPATAAEPVPEEWDGAPSAATGRVVIMTLSKRRPEPEPKTADPGELRKHALAKRPPRRSN
jgi:hypothetical protein